MERNKELGQILLKRRLTLTLTQAKVARASRVSISHISRVEKSERYPSALTLNKLAAPLGYEVSELLKLAGYLPETADATPERDEYFNGVMVLECPKCQHQWVEKLDLPMEVGAAVARMKAASICPKCGNGKGVMMLLGDRYRAALKELGYATKI